MNDALELVDRVALKEQGKANVQALAGVRAITSQTLECGCRLVATDTTVDSMSSNHMEDAVKEKTEPPPTSPFPTLPALTSLYRQKITLSNGNRLTTTGMEAFVRRTHPPRYHHEYDPERSKRYRWRMTETGRGDKRANGRRKEVESDQLHVPLGSARRVVRWRRWLRERKSEKDVRPCRPR
jgi:hypothetical protein